MGTSHPTRSAPSFRNGTLAGLISAVFGRSTILTARIAAFEQMFGKAIAALREKSSEAAEILEQLGLIGLGA